ncbi:MAG: tetratricopeptide repeat protein [Gammaproteobacteria bacterium]
MNQARTALDQGNLNEAERLYEQWLTQRPHSTAARFGLARLFLLQGRVDQARLMYLDILQIEPVNSTAQASLINLPGTGSPESRRRLQFLLEQNPDDPYLNYVMGNQQAGLTRWDEAQKYYFQATALKRDNAIYAFNLAIALDHLQKPDAAASYYRRALELTTPPLGQAHRQQVIDRLKNIANTKG